MAPFKISIHPITAADIPAQAQLLLESKLALTINRVLYKDWPNTETQLAHCTSVLGDDLSDLASERWKAVDDESGVMVGYVVLTQKEPTQEKGEGEGEGNFPDAMSREVLGRVIEVVKELDIQKEREHLQVTHVFIKPTYRRQGIGPRLINIGLDKAREAGIPFVVRSEPEAHEFFLRSGWKDVKHADIDLRQFAAEYSGFGIFRLSAMVAK